VALLHRFRHKRFKQGSLEEELASIVENLNHILNTRRGYGSFLTDYGISDLSDRTNRDQLQLAVMAEVEECIRRFEPRLLLRKIEPVDAESGLRMAFRLDCDVRSTQKPFRIVFDTLYSSFDVGENAPAGGEK